MPTPPAPSPRPQPTPNTGSGQRPPQNRPTTYGSQTTPRPGPAPGYRANPIPAPQPVRPGFGVFPPRSAPPTPRPKATAPARPPPPPVPSILSLVALPQSYIATLSIGTLKAILYENHVKVDFSQVLEKTELVKRVQMLVTEERKRLERQRAAEEAEEAEERGMAAASRASVDIDPTRNTDSPDSAAGAEAIPVPTGPTASVERDGLCVVCQDQEAVFANIDCGHLCMCPDCSKLVLATTRECPMCRTR